MTALVTSFDNKMPPKTARIHLVQPDWQGTLPHFLLRAAHYLDEFHGIQQLHLDCPEVPAPVMALLRKSLDLRNRKIEIHCEGTPYAHCKAFCAPDFPMYTDSGVINLGIPHIPNLTDFHVHTPLAYCSENMDIAATLEIERLSGVSYVNFSEHSGQLLASAPTYRTKRFLWRNRQKEDDRTPIYEQLIQNSPPALYGLELDVDEEAVVIDLHTPSLNGYRLGAVHFLHPDLSFDEKKADFMRRLDALLASGIHILAHPFRVFPIYDLPIPEELFAPVAERLIAAGVAAEINFHTNQPQPEFVELLLKKGGKISFGTDSHNLYEPGFLRPHYDFCQSLGIAGKLDEILLSHQKG